MKISKVITVFFFSIITFSGFSQQKEVQIIATKVTDQIYMLKGAR